MTTLTKRQQQIFMYFYDANDFLTSKKLSSLLNISSKTIRNEIKNINYLIASFAKIESLPGKGYQLVIIDHEQLNKFQKQLHKEKFDYIPTTPLERAYYILGLMLKKQEFIKIDDLSELLYIDRTSISRSLKIIREILERYNLKLIQKAKKGIKITGDEFCYRQCMAEYVYHNLEITIPEIANHNDFINELNQVIFNDGITMPKRVFNDFVVHIQVQIERIKAGYLINFSENKRKQIENEYELLVAKDIASLIDKYFGISFNDMEKAYLTIHILGKKSNSTSAIENCINDQLKPEIDSIVLNMLQQINSVFKIDFTNDMYLRKAIGMHINSTKNRIKFNTFLRNPLIDDIKQNYLYGYMMSLEAWKTLSNNTKFINYEDEIGYIAIHFQYAIERRKRNISKKRILLVNDYSIATSELLSFTLLKNYRDSLTIENSIAASELDNYDLTNFDCLISTVPISPKIKIPIIRINPIINDQDLKKLRLFLKDTNHSITDYIFKENIHFIKIETRQEFYQIINQSVTYQEIEMNNHIVILYTSKPHYSSALEIYCLNKPILWKSKYIKAIILLNIGDDNEYMIESLQKFLSFSKNIEFLLQITNANDLLIYLSTFHF